MPQFPNNDPDKDRNLVQFLQQYQPIAPSASHHLEERIMNLVHQNSRSSSQENRRLWIIPSAIAAGLCLAWAGSLWLEPNSQFAARDSQSQEVAAFLVDNWQNVTDSSVNLQSESSLANQWQSLTYSEVSSTDLSSD